MTRQEPNFSPFSSSFPSCSTGKQDRENILRARATGNRVLTSPFKLLKSNHLGIVLTFAVYNKELPPDATPGQYTETTMSSGECRL